MWDLIVSVPDHCLSFYFDAKRKKKVIDKQTSKRVSIHVFRLICLIPMT